MGPRGPKGNTGAQGPGAQSTYGQSGILIGGDVVFDKSLVLTAGDWSVAYEANYYDGSCALLPSTNLTILNEIDPANAYWETGTVVVAIAAGGATLTLQCSEPNGDAVSIDLTATPTKIQ